MNKIIIVIGVVVVVGIVAVLAFGRSKPADVASATPTPGGLKIETLVEGKGAGAKSGDTLSVLYSGTLTDGRVFDASSLHDNKAFDFTLGAGTVIPGWDQGLVGMKEGEKRKLTIPSELAYGEAGAPGSIIGANATLIFEVTLVKLTPAK